MEIREPKPGDAYIFKLRGKTEIAICIGISRKRHHMQGQYRFTYSHWNYFGANWLSVESISQYEMKFSRIASILYGRKEDSV